jgi:hypothetical protein
VSLVTGNKASIQPKILTPSLLFRNLPDDKFETVLTQSEETYLEMDKLFPQIPSSRLSLDFCSFSSRALYLANLRRVSRDLGKLRIQRDALDHLIYQSQDQLEVLSLQPAVLTEQLILIDSNLYSHVHVIKELRFASWISKERRQRAPYLTAMREFAGYFSHWITSEIFNPGMTMQQRAEVLIHFVVVGECLAELASYNMLAAVIRGLSTPAILRIGPLFEILLKRTLMSWDTLQGQVQETIK